MIALHRYITWLLSNSNLQKWVNYSAPVQGWQFSVERAQSIAIYYLRPSRASPTLLCQKCAQLFYKTVHIIPSTILQHIFVSHSDMRNSKNIGRFDSEYLVQCWSIVWCVVAVYCCGAALIWIVSTWVARTKRVRGRTNSAFRSVR